MISASPARVLKIHFAISFFAPSADCQFVSRNSSVPDSPHVAEAATHKSSEGAQLADVVASAFYQAIDTLTPTKWNNEFAKLLKSVVAKEDGHYFNYGFALQPTPPSKARLTDQQKEIFEFYGYGFWP
jgi:hypothetical protein